MGTQINTQPQTFKNASTVMGAAAGLSAVSGLTVYGDISASGTIYGTGAPVPVSTTYTFNGSTTTFAINGFTNTTAVNYLVYLDGVHQVPVTDYSLSATSGGGNVIMATAPANGVVANVVAFQSSVAAYALSGVRPVVSSGTGTGSQTAFTITGYTDNNPENYLVVVGGLTQKPGTDYTVSANTINFTTAIPNGVAVLVIAWQTTPSTTAASLFVSSEGGASSGNVSSISFANGLSARVTAGDAVVQLPEATAGKVLTYSGTTSAWVASAALPPGTAGNVLTFNGTTSTWVASAAPGGGTAPNGAKAWVNFNGRTGTIRASYNVSSITLNGTLDTDGSGDVTISFTNALADANYVVHITPSSWGVDATWCVGGIRADSYNAAPNLMTTGQVRVVYGGKYGAASNWNHTTVTAAIFGN